MSAGAGQDVLECHAPLRELGTQTPVNGMTSWYSTGWPSDKCAKRKIDAQRDFLLEALCNGSSHNFEGEMFLGALKSMPVTSDVIKTACLSYSADDGFTASYKSSEASEWACSGR